MNKRVASLAKGFLSVFLILSLVLPSVAVPHTAWANLGGGETGAGGFESDVGEGPDGQSSAEAADAAAEAAGQAANDAAAAGLSANAPEGVSVSGSDATPDSDPNNPTVDVDFGNGQTVSGVSPQAAEAMMDAVAAGLAPATNGQTPGFNPSATAEAHATGKAGIDGVVGNVSATLGSVASVAAAESKAAIGLAAAQAAADATAKSMNPFGAAPAVNSLSFTTLSADDALSAASKHPAMFSPNSLSTSLPAGFTFSPPTQSSKTLSPTPIGGKTTAQTFSLDNATIDATSFSLGKQLGVPSMPGFDAPVGGSYSTTKSDDTSKNQYAQYALGMEIGRYATQKSLAESKYNSLVDNATFNPATQNAQMAMLDATKAEIDAWSATIDSKLNPTTQNQAVANISQTKAADLGKMADQIAATTDSSKAAQLSKSMAEAIAAYDSQISEAKSSAQAAQNALDAANKAAQLSVYGVVDVTPTNNFSVPDESLVDQAWGKVFGIAPTQLDPITAQMLDTLEEVLSVVPVVGPVNSAVLSITPTPVINAVVDAIPGVKSTQAYMNNEPISVVLGLAFVDAVTLGFGKAVSVGIAGSVAGKASISAPGSTTGKVGTAGPSTVSTAGKTASNSTGKNVSLSYNPTNNTVTVHAPISTSAVVEGKIGASAAKSADNVATLSSLSGKAADDVATPSSATAGKTSPASTGNNPANPNAAGYQTAATPAATAAKSADNVAAPSSLAGKAADDVATPSSATAGKTSTAANANTPANPNALGSKSVTTPTQSVSPASKSLSVAMAVVEALNAPVSISPAAISKSLAGIVDDIALAISRTADDINISTPVSVAVKSADDVVAPTAAKTADNTAAPATVSGTGAKSTPVSVTAPVSVPVSVTPTTVQTPAQPTVAPQTTAPAQTAVKATADNISVPFSPLSPLSQAQVQSIAKSITDTTQPTVLGTIAVDMPESLGRTSTLGSPQTATLSSNPTTGLVDVTLDNQPKAQVNSITPAQAQNALASAKATPMPDDFLTQTLAALTDFFAPPTEVIGTFTLSIPDKTATPVGVAVTTVSPTEAVAAPSVAAPSSLAGKAADDVATPSSATAGKTSPASTGNNPANPNAAGYQTAATPANQTAPATTQAPATPSTNQTSPATAQPAPIVASPAVQAPASTLGPVSDALSTIGKGLTDAFNELFGVKPAASQPAKTVNFANLERTPETQDFVGAVADDARFLSFEDNTTAARALLRDLENKIKDLEASKTPATLNNIIPKYSPASDNNNPTQHANNIASVAAKDVPGFTADTPITLADLKGPVGVGLVKGFAKAEEGISLPTAEAAKGVAAYTALPSIPTTLVDGVYAPTNPADQVTLNNIRNGSPATVAPATQTPAQTLLAVADKLSKSTPASLALEIQAGAAGRLAQALPQAAEPAVANPGAQTQAPAQISPAVADVKGVNPVQGGMLHGNSPEVGPRTRVNSLGVAYPSAHRGTDIYPADLKANRPVVSRYNGTVISIKLKSSGYGKYVEVKNDNGTYSRYAHIEPASSLKTGDTVTAGQQLGKISGAGTAFGRIAAAIASKNNLDPDAAYDAAVDQLNKSGWGNVTRPHLHYEERSAPGALGGTALIDSTKSLGYQRGVTYALGATAGNTSPQVASVPAPTLAAPTTVPTPTSRPDVQTPVPANQPVTTPGQTATTPISATPNSVVPSTATTPSNQTPSSGSAVNDPAVPSVQTPANSQVSPEANTGNPPGNLGNPLNNTPAPKGPVGPGVTSRIGWAALNTMGVLVAIINEVFGTDIPIPSSDSQVTTTPISTTLPADSDTDTNTPAGTGADEPSDNTNSGTPTSNETNRPSNEGGPIIDRQEFDGASTSTKQTINVLIQVDGNTGDIYFDIAGVYDGGEYHEDYEWNPEDPEEYDPALAQPRIVLDDQRLNILYSDGTYAPVVIDGVWYESADDPKYVYTVEYYLDGKLVGAADNAGVLPEGNPLTNLLGNLFSSSDEYGLEDVDTITRALVDPDEQVPADEYYIYRVYLNGGGTRSTTVPRYTSHRFMTDRFAETGFTGNVTALIAESVEVPPPSRGGVSAIVDTFKKIGLSVVDIFRDDEAENPVVTDFGNLTPSDDGEITMADIRNVTVLLDVEAECPLAPGLDRPYLYEIVIAQAAISDAATDQAFRAVRCGGGDKADFVEQIAAHFETFDGVGAIDRQAMSDMIRFALFEDLDLSFLLDDDDVEIPVATSTPATVPDGEDQEYVPNLTNDVVFEVKAVGSQGQTLLDWSVANEIRIGSTVQLYFRWDGSDYEQCLPFLNDNGIYALKASGGKMTTGNTESEGYDVPETSATYRLECGGQRNNEFGVDDRSIKVIIE